MTEIPVSGVALQIRDLLLENPEGLTIADIRARLAIDGQQHLDRRVRELYAFYSFDNRWSDGEYYYRIRSRLTEPHPDEGRVTKRDRAYVLNRDGRRCQMCGRTVKDDHVTLHVDHKIPKSWGGSSDPSNLWTLCRECNEGKQAHFASLDASVMAPALARASVHERLAFILRANEHEWVEDDLLEFAANFGDYQTDWRKRLRELRYLGLKIESSRKKIGRRTHSYYKLTNWVDLPIDVASFVRDHERRKKASE